MSTFFDELADLEEAVGALAVDSARPKESLENRDRADPDQDPDQDIKPTMQAAKQDDSDTPSK